MNSVVLVNPGLDLAARLASSTSSSGSVTDF
jgi:hypothetical protein